MILKTAKIKEQSQVKAVSQLLILLTQVHQAAAHQAQVHQAAVLQAQAHQAAVLQVLHLQAQAQLSQVRKQQYSSYSAV